MSRILISFTCDENLTKIEPTISVRMHFLWVYHQGAETEILKVHSRLNRWSDRHQICIAGT